MIDWFSDIKYFYEKKLWTKKQVFDVVGKRITPEQYLPQKGLMGKLTDLLGLTQ